MPDWISAIIGGALIGTSLCLFVVLNNKRSGVGDMLQYALENGPSTFWNNQILFLIGLIVSPITFATFFYPVRIENLQDKPLLFIFSGLMVGIGYKLCRGGLLTRTFFAGFSNIQFSTSIILFFLFSGGISRNLLILSEN